MPEEPLEEKTEQPTPRRREEARRRGQIVRSRELSSVAIIASATFVFFLLSSFLFYQFYFIFYHSFNSFNLEINLNNLIYLFKSLFSLVAKIIIPLFIIVSLAAILIYLLQSGGGVLATEVIRFDFDRINPVEGFKRMFSLVSLFELLKALLKLLIIIGVVYLIVSKNFENILKLFGADVKYISFSIKVFTKDLIFKFLVVLAILAILDWLYNWWDVERKLKLTRQELKEEIKQTEGDPRVKARIRQKQIELSRRRMLAEVRRADVVITNPEHYAVALRYEVKTMPAPQVIAKGKDFLALKIKEIAQENKIPIYEDPPLARLLYEKVELGAYIPEELYQVIAKILAYVYKLKGKKLL
ncbi:MAG: flagellar biosynthesis protein FlhB [Thermodesulfobacteriaceae bacterium]|nr:flagellar biosynthesis protein FlhB [Thermodesulfobacteriaceae bacterium]MDW8135852.1 flagellar biosynthesis protein FlhB [Thermodesulfobacterium sp.]